MSATFPLPKICERFWQRKWKTTSNKGKGHILYSSPLQAEGNSNLNSLFYMSFFMYITIVLWPVFRQIVLIDMGAGVPNVSMLRLMLIILAFSYLIRQLIARSLKFDLVLKCFTLFFFYLLTDLTLNGFSTGKLQIILDVYLMPSLAYFMIINSNCILKRNYLALSVILSGMLMGLLGIMEAVFQRNLFGPADIRWAGSFFRTNGPFDDGITFAHVMLFFVPFGAYCYDKAIANKYLIVFSILTCSLASALNLSRACLIVEVTIFFVLLFRKSLVRTLVVSYIIVILIIIPFYVLHDSLQEESVYTDRFSDATTIAGRYERYKYLIAEFTKNPVLGEGFNKLGERLNPHSTYLQYLAELGLVGFSFWILFIYSPFMVIHRLARDNLADASYFKSIVSIGIIIIVVPLTVSSLNSVEVMFQYLVIMGSYQRLFTD